MTTPLKQILCVEDNDSIAEVVKMTLEDVGSYVVTHCASGQEALETLRTAKPQLVLLDVMMPGMDGPETMRRMRQMPEGADIPVVFMTARMQLHEQAQYMELGAAGVIAKPFDPMQLCDDIETIWTGLA
jgi:two-component system, OmpR family, response regulator